MSTTERIIDVFLLVANAPTALTAKEISQQSGLPSSTVYRLLGTLAQSGLVAQHEQGGYSPGPMCLRIAANAASTSLLLAQAIPVMQTLALRSGESVALMLPLGKEAVCLEMIESTQSLRCSFSRGRAQPLLRGASAKALLAHMLPAAQQEVISYFEATDVVPADFQAQLDQIRLQGYAVTESEVDAGVWGVSAPIFSRQGLEGALSLMAPAVRAEQREAELVGAVVQSAQEVSEQLGAAGLQPTQPRTQARPVPLSAALAPDHNSRETNA